MKKYWLSLSRSALAAIGILAINVSAFAQTTLFWGGGNVDITNGTPLPTTGPALTGTWDTLTKNWATSGTTYVPWADGAIANLGYFTGPTDPSITLASDVQISGLRGILSTATNASRAFNITATSPQTITPAGDSFLVHVQSNDPSRRITLASNVTLSGPSTLIKDGNGQFQLAGNNSAYTGAVNILSGQLSVSGALNGVTLFRVAGYPPNAINTGYAGNEGFTSPTLMVTAAAGANDKIADNAVITLSRGSIDYRSASTSTETIGRIALENHGILDLSQGNAGGVLTLSDATSGITRGANGLATLIVGVAGSGTTLASIRVNNGLVTDVLQPWISTSRGQFMKVDSSNNTLTPVASTDAPTDLSTWAPGQDYRVGGNGGTFTGATGAVPTMAINSLGFFHTGKADATATASPVVIGDGNTLTITSGGITFSPASASVSALRGGSLTSGTDKLYVTTGNTNSGGFTITSKLTGTFDLIKAGFSNLNLTGTVSNDYVGTTYVNMGHLNISPAAAGVIGVPGDLVIRGGASAGFGGTGTAIASTANITIESDGLLSMTSQTIGGTMTIDGGTVIFGNLNAPVLNKPGTGLVFNGGYFVQNSGAGTLNLNTNVSYAASSTKQAIFRAYSAYNIELDGAERTFNIANSSTLPTNLAEMVVDTRITNGSGPGSLRKTGDGTLQLTGTNTYTGDTIIDGGTVQLSTISGAAQSGLVGTPNGSGAINPIVTFTKPITGSLAVGMPITGSGITAGRKIAKILNEYEVILDGVALATGSTTGMIVTDIAVGAVSRVGSLAGNATVNNTGKLQVDAGSVVGGSVTVVAGGTLAGSGTVNGAVAISGNLAPGTLTLGSTLDLSASGTAGTLALGIGTVNDHVEFATLGDNLIGGSGSFVLDLSTGAGFSTGVAYTVFYNVSTDGFVPGIVKLDGATLTGGEYTWNDLGSSYAITLVIPEPSTFMMLAGGLGVLTLFRRRSARR